MAVDVVPGRELCAVPVQDVERSAVNSVQSVQHGHPALQRRLHQRRHQPHGVTAGCGAALLQQVPGRHVLEEGQVSVTGR